MEYFQEQIYDKPQHLEDNDLIAIIDLYDVPINVRGMDITYNKSELAVNEKEGLIQVYVLANSSEGLSDFLEDYPNAEIKEDATLQDPANWKVLAFTGEAIPDESTPLDNYYQGRTKELGE